MRVSKCASCQADKMNWKLCWFTFLSGFTHSKFSTPFIFISDTGVKFPLLNRNRWIKFYIYDFRKNYNQIAINVNLIKHISFCLFCLFFSVACSVSDIAIMWSKFGRCTIAFTIWLSSQCIIDKWFGRSRSWAIRCPSIKVLHFYFFFFADPIPLLNVGHKSEIEFRLFPSSIR